MTIHEAPAVGDGTDTERAAAAIAEVEAHTAHNYHPLPVVLATARAPGSPTSTAAATWTCSRATSALNFGHRNPVLTAAPAQLGRLTLTSRAFHNDLLGAFARELADLCGMDAVLPMNTGAEAVETALKMARKWGYERKGVPEGRAKIVVMRGQLPRPDHHDHQVQRRPGGSSRVRPVHAGVRDRALRRRRGAGRRGRRRHRARARRAHPGRGGRAHPAGRLPAAVARALHASATC